MKRRLFNFNVERGLETMKIYHGSNQKVATPSILIGRKNLDFGCGFYTTSDFDQAKS